MNQVTDFDLYLALGVISNSGIIDFSFPFWELDSETEDQWVFGTYTFEVRYFGRNT